jgi:hypothetical protein
MGTYVKWTVPLAKCLQSFGRLKHLLAVWRLLKVSGVFLSFLIESGLIDLVDLYSCFGQMWLLMELWFEAPQFLRSSFCALLEYFFL